MLSDLCNQILKSFIISQIYLKQKKVTSRDLEILPKNFLSSLIQVIQGQISKKIIRTLQFNLMSFTETTRERE